MTSRTGQQARMLAAAERDLIAQANPGGSYPAAFGKLCGMVETIGLYAQLGMGEDVARKLAEAIEFIEDWRAYHDTVRGPSFAHQHSEGEF